MAVVSSVLLLLITASRYGFHRDEVYFVVAGRNLDWGYVDQPPFTPLVARLSELVAGPSPFALRVLPALAVGAIGVMAALLAKRFGGGKSAQGYAAAATGFAGVVLGEGHLLSTAIFDFALWTAALLVMAHILGGASPKLWLVLGLVVGVGVQNKHTMLLLAGALLVGILFTKDRVRLFEIWPWLGVLLAAAIALPNLLWQLENGFPQLEMAQALQARSQGPLAFVLFQPLLLSVVLAVPVAIGWWRLTTSKTLESWRVFGFVYGILFVAFLLTGGKAYYIAPMYSVLLAAGAIWFEGLRPTAKRLMAVLTALGLMVGVLISLPVVPVSSSSTFDATGELGETVGWPELVEQVADVYQAIPIDQRPRVAILTGTYGEAGAIDLLGREAGLPKAVSGHNNYYLWGPPDEHGPVIGVGYVDGVMDLICPGFETVATISNPYGVENEVAGLSIYLCIEPASQLSDVWDSVKHFN